MIQSIAFKKTFLFFIGALSLAGCSSFNIYRNNPKTALTVSPVWVRQSPAMENEGFKKVNRFTPIFSAHRLIVGNGIDGISAFDIESGQLLWRFPVKDGVEASASFIKDRLFIGGSDGNVYCLSLSKGEKIWNYSTNSEILGQPLLHEDLLYVQTGSGLLMALDAASGTPRWTYNRADSSPLSIRGASTPAFDSGRVFVGFSDGSLVALTAASGQVAWEVSLNKNKRFKDIDATAVVYKDQLVVSGFDDKIYSLEKQTGQVLWAVEGGGSSSVTVKNDVIYASSSDGMLRALKGSDGSLLWKRKFSNGITTQPVSYLGALVVGESQGSLFFLKANDGSTISSFTPGRGILATPSVDEKKEQIYFISGEGNLYNLRASYKNKLLLKESR